MDLVLDCPAVWLSWVACWRICLSDNEGKRCADGTPRISPANSHSADQVSLAVNNKERIFTYLWK